MTCVFAAPPNACAPGEPSWKVTEEFAPWLAQSNGTIALTTYQAGQIAFIHYDPASDDVAVNFRSFDKPMGLAVKGSTCALATRNHLVMLSASPGKTDSEHLSQAPIRTGDIAMHDVAFASSSTTPDVAYDKLWFINTRYSTLCSLDGGRIDTHWAPSFVTERTPEDRCHLNGLALRDGRPSHVTALGTTDVAGMWRVNKGTGGVLIDLDSDERVLEGLCMPHSPRWFRPAGSDEPEKLYFLNSGRGEICVMSEADAARGQYTVVAALPGFTRGLSFYTSPRTGRSYAIIGLSHVRSTHVFDNLPVQKRWRGKLMAGVSVVDLTDGRHVASLEFTTAVTELYDVQFMQSVID